MAPTAQIEAPAGARARRTYDALLAATEACLASGGYAAATSTAIAAEAGVSVGSFYAYFADREQALAALFALRLDDLLSALGEVLTIERLLDDGLEPTVTSTVKLVLAHYGRHAPAFRAALVQLASSRSLHDVYWTAHRRSEEALTRFVRRGQTAGKIRRADPVVLAQTLLVVLQAGNTPLLLAKRRSAAARGVECELVRALVHLLAPER